MSQQEYAIIHTYIHKSYSHSTLTTIRYVLYVQYIKSLCIPVFVYNVVHVLLYMYVVAPCGCYVPLVVAMSMPRYLLELDCEGDPAWDCISNMCLWILRLLFTSKEDFQQIQGDRVPGELAYLPGDLAPVYEPLPPSLPPRTRSTGREGHSRSMSDVSYASTSSYGSQTTYTGTIASNGAFLLLLVCCSCYVYCCCNCCFIVAIVLLYCYYCSFACVV